jgi:hypothetical protein
VRVVVMVVAISEESTGRECKEEEMNGKKGFFSINSLVPSSRQCAVSVADVHVCVGRCVLEIVLKPFDYRRRRTFEDPGPISF